eukprot:83939-Hanusia_phi.AAC.14
MTSKHLTETTYDRYFFYVDKQALLEFANYRPVSMTQFRPLKPNIRLLLCRTLAESNDIDSCLLAWYYKTSYKQPKMLLESLDLDQPMEVCREKFHHEVQLEEIDATQGQRYEKFHIDWLTWWPPKRNRNVSKARYSDDLAISLLLAL